MARKNRIRKTITTSAKRPRMTVSITLRNVTAQIIDDESGKTLVAATSKTSDKGNLTEKAIKVGAEIAKSAKAKKIKQVVLDRNGRKYHGRIKALAEAARKEGLEF